MLYINRVFINKKVKAVQCGVDGIGAVVDDKGPTDGRGIKHTQRGDLRSINWLLLLHRPSSGATPKASKLFHPQTNGSKKIRLLCYYPRRRAAAARVQSFLCKSDSSDLLDLPLVDIGLVWSVHFAIDVVGKEFFGQFKIKHTAARDQPSIIW